MKINFKNRTLHQLMVCLISLLLVSCGVDDSQVNYGYNLIYMPQQSQAINSSSVSYNVPGKEVDPRTFNYKKNGSNIDVLLGIECSGKVVNKTFSVDITTKPDTINSLIAAGTLGKNVILMPSDMYTLPSHIDVAEGKNQATFSLSIDSVKLKSYSGKKLALAVALNNPTTFSLNAPLSTTIVLVTVNSIFGIGQVKTIAGSGTAGALDGIGLSAQFNNTCGVVSDASSNLYVLDYASCNIKKITIATGQVTTIAGTGAAGSVNGIGTAASFNYPMGLAIDPAYKYLYVSCLSDHLIRRVEIATNTVTTFGGIAGSSGSTDGAFGVAKFNAPKGLVVDPTGTYLYVSGGADNKIRRIEIVTGIVSTLAGSGTAGSADGTGIAATFNGPRGITIDAANQNLYVTDYAANKIRKIVIATGVVTTLAGTGTPAFADGIGTAASFNAPFGITIDSNGNLFVCDVTNNRIRKIIIATGEVSTFAGTGTAGSTDGAALDATFNLPKAITKAPNGLLYVGDASSYKIRSIN